MNPRVRLLAGSRDNCKGYDESDCEPLLRNGSMLLNPCGLIANSLFNGK